MIFAIWLVSCLLISALLIWWVNTGHQKWSDYLRAKQNAKLIRNMEKFRAEKRAAGEPPPQTWNVSDFNS